MGSIRRAYGSGSGRGCIDVHGCPYVYTSQISRLLELLDIQIVINHDGSSMLRRYENVKTLFYPRLFIKSVLYYLSHGQSFFAGSWNLPSLRSPTHRPPHRITVVQSLRNLSPTLDCPYSVTGIYKNSSSNLKQFDLNYM